MPSTDDLDDRHDHAYDDANDDANDGRLERLDVRIQPCATQALGPLARVAVAVVRAATHGDDLRVVTTVARHRRLLRHWVPFAAGLLRGTELGRDDVELVILRTAWNCASPYVWAQHVPLARAAGLGADVAARVGEADPAGGWTARQGALLLATDELHERRVITDATWERLAATLNDRELIELCFVVGQYEMVAMTVNSLGVLPEPTAQAHLDATEARAGRALHRRLAARRHGVAWPAPRARGGQGPLGGGHA